MNLSLLAIPLALSLFGGHARAADSAAVGAAVPLRVATFNTWGLAYPVASPARELRFPRIEAALEALEADVVGLQEVWRGAWGLLDLGPRLHQLRHGGDTGLALVSPHPVSHMQTHAYDDARGIDAVKRKGVLSARVHLPGADPVVVTVTHLQAGGGLRNAQIRGR